MQPVDWPALIQLWAQVCQYKCRVFLKKCSLLGVRFPHQFRRPQLLLDCDQRKHPNSYTVFDSHKPGHGLEGTGASSDLTESSVSLHHTVKTIQDICHEINVPLTVETESVKF